MRQSQKYRAGTMIKGYVKQEVYTPPPPPPAQLLHALVIKCSLIVLMGHLTAKEFNFLHTVLKLTF